MKYSDAINVNVDTQPKLNIYMRRVYVVCSLGILHLSRPGSFINFREYHNNHFRLDNFFRN